MKYILMAIALAVLQCNASMDKLIEAVIHVESKGNVNAIGDDGRAVGPLQIWKEVVDDVNKWSSTKFTYGDRLDLEKSKKMFKLYVKHYATKSRLNRNPTNKDYARIWNGGPNGHKKNATIAYWQKVKSKMVNQFFS